VFNTQSSSLLLSSLRFFIQLDKDTGSAVLCGNLWTNKETTTYTANTDKSHLFFQKNAKCLL